MTDTAPQPTRPPREGPPPGGPGPTDVLIIGGGPAALALAAELCARQLSVRVVAPHAPTPFRPTYGAWLDALPAWAQACAAQVWTDVRVYTGPKPTPLLRPYALLDNARLLRALLERAGEGLHWTLGTVRTVDVDARGPGGAAVVHGAGGERWPARVVVDASGHGAVVNPLQFPGGPAFQTAFGLVARFRRPPIAPGAMVWMDYRGPAHPPRLPTFLYAMHLGGDRYFVEETSLIARPAPDRGFLERRLRARLEEAGTPPHQTESSEWVAFPMNAAAPAPGPVLAFGAAAGLVHPISGFQVSGALQDAPVVAQALAQALASGTDAAQAGWDALWPPERRAARDLHLLGVRALLALPGDALPAFFQSFFRLGAPQWQAFLDPRTPTGPLARTMLQVFAGAPWSVRRPLAAAGVADAGVSVRALSAAMKRPSPPSHLSPAAARHPGAMTRSMDAQHDDATLQREDLDQTETVEEGMQGSTGSTDANGLDPQADQQEKFQELRDNLAPLAGQQE
ncbi:lycopene cyclase family protein [Deinococcus koreensis]|uniref:Carotenoid cyclase n=1 Tax=Deinococcus koreensis TaxID=2054903 RepID=A0A2K3V102_9DEIO|nr:lycopene cyclase family protein [Deinococcus koreensis]PNY82459.1 carotenoid cyclase [Deinococcus koreensis]